MYESTRFNIVCSLYASELKKLQRQHNAFIVAVVRFCVQNFLLETSVENY